MSAMRPKRVTVGTRLIRLKAPCNGQLKTFKNQLNLLKMLLGGWLPIFQKILVKPSSIIIETVLEMNPPTQIFLHVGFNCGIAIPPS